jgi:aspartyl-tRNA(Asn)/glutamyl-tRNA(Gln) amidotransferase subunit A
MQAAGAISIGKASTHQFAFGPTTESTHIGPCHNPWDIGRTPGGSSGGSAALVGARVVGCALGSDTGGSIRIPAAACGVVGFKPTYGRASKAGVITLSWSLDTVGPLTARVEDAALAVAALAGPDPLDQTTADVPIGDYVAAARRGRREGARGLRVGLLADWVQDRVDPGIQAAVRTAADALGAAGAEIAEAELPDPGPMALVNRLISMCEGAAYHAPLLERHADLYAADVRTRFELGQFVLARDYLLAQRLRTEMARRVNALMERFDLLLLPTLPIGAPRIGQATVNWSSGSEPAPESMIRFTAPFNLSGHPVCSIPVGRSSEGMPASVQLVGRHFAEETVLQAAAALEQAVSPAPER